MEKPAVLDNHQLTFALAGAANIVHKPGWSVHGVVMECKTEVDWERIVDFDHGYAYLEVEVLPYTSKEPIMARTFVMAGDALENAKLPSNRLPQERFIRIVAEGMKYHGVEQEVIDFHIMNVPYIPSRKPDEYRRFSADINSKKRSKIKTISYDDYLMKSKKMVWIAIGGHVVHVKPTDENDSMSGPFLQWVKQNLVGKSDCTQYMMQVCYDPTLSWCENGVTDLHRRWAENVLVEKFEQGDLTGILVCFLKDPSPPRRLSRRVASLVLPRTLSFWRKEASSNDLQQFLCDATKSGDSRTTLASLANSARSSIGGD
eukprot:CAMPEP_0119023266 /NCGR_PEP_ID=MMETSP1176-20130426/29629_1 /TAXON_ID=265551 /ORGANISM="Synedropsis recta cf, Strain CCMP1620" /LENGTH=315 /DNA_ID=CAMNT_0006978313 /DNA_START=1 /DNA_END=948 /DNA_ORIENTATION=+